MQAANELLAQARRAESRGDGESAIKLVNQSLKAHDTEEGSPREGEIGRAIGRHGLLGWN